MVCFCVKVVQLLLSPLLEVATFEPHYFVFHFSSRLIYPSAKEIIRSLESIAYFEARLQLSRRPSVPAQADEFNFVIAPHRCQK